MSKRFDLSDKVALVTGASSGLGVHFARTLASAGASVAIAARRTDRLASLQAELQQAGDKAIAVALDVQSGKSVGAALDSAEAALGAIDIVVNNAGISIVKPSLDMPEEDWDAVVDTNLRGAWLSWLTTWLKKARVAAALRSGDYLKVLDVGEQVLLRNPWDVSTQVAMATAARELKAMQDEMRAALWRNARLAAVGTAVAKISHDLRNILSSALLVADTLQETADPEIGRAHD